MNVDPLADMFTVIRNASRAKKEKAEIPSSKLKLGILELLKKEGYIKNYKFISDNKQGVVRVYLKYKKDNAPVITQIKRISTPGRRVYVPKDKVPKVLRGWGMAIVSTSQGVLSDEQTRAQGLGGEVLCHVW
ncbi:MAG: 30S ribosomal protein S8 [Candidatus Omnitrophota bacterium]